MDNNPYSVYKNSSLTIPLKKLINSYSRCVTYLIYEEGVTHKNIFYESMNILFRIFY